MNAVRLAICGHFGLEKKANRKMNASTVVEEMTILCELVDPDE